MSRVWGGIFSIVVPIAALVAFGFPPVLEMAGSEFQIFGVIFFIVFCIVTVHWLRVPFGKKDGAIRQWFGCLGWSALVYVCFRLETWFLAEKYVVDNGVHLFLKWLIVLPPIVAAILLIIVFFRFLAKKKG